MGVNDPSAGAHLKLREDPAVVTLWVLDDLVNVAHQFLVSFGEITGTFLSVVGRAPQQSDCSKAPIRFGRSLQADPLNGPFQWWILQ